MSQRTCPNCSHNSSSYNVYRNKMNHYCQLNQHAFWTGLLPRDRWRRCIQTGEYWLDGISYGLMRRRCSTGECWFGSIWWGAEQFGHNHNIKNLCCDVGLFVHTTVCFIRRLSWNASSVKCVQNVVNSLLTCTYWIAFNGNVCVLQCRVNGSSRLSEGRKSNGKGESKCYSCQAEIVFCVCYNISENSYKELRLNMEDGDLIYGQEPIVDPEDYHHYLYSCL